ncbi:V-set domain-containing T-cell activation inhibitor 1 [Pygocentrus nattereri]|uniref:HERV-H LTR-associating 2b, tandem duplicate 2 n=1 Tax=Pygocentrus nattereri TaxID=42514 RepID=A0A3B4BNH0_PYGNA|nr:V-set domain-containing T-cell activation inhibitor 1 [Pygocentrus nattereri]
MNQLIRTVTLLWSLALTTGDDTVTCLYSQECVLPCKSDYREIIHWQKLERQTTVNVHSFYSGTDQLKYQNEAYRGRTSMFSDQVSKGNMSLILKEVRTQDRGRYKCYTAISSANKEAFVSVKVKAPIKSVDIKMTDDGITCKTSDVYPKPKISWTINGTPKIISPKDPQEDSRGLFSLTSTLPVQPVQDSLTYTCSISSEDSTQTYIASLTEEKTEIDLGQDITIPCPGSQGETGNFTLTFGSSTVLSYNSETPQPDRIQWNGIEVKVTSKGNIILHKLDSERHAGTYTCEKLTTQSRQLIQTSVQIRTASTVGIIIAVTVSIVVAITVAVIAYVIKKRRSKTSENNGQEGSGGTGHNGTPLDDRLQSEQLVEKRSGTWTD